MNIHPISNDLWMRRQREVAPALTKVVEDSVSSTLIDEQNATIEAGQDNRISVSVDGAWQSRGSGRSYSSASG